jgi:hypothetical protein
VGKELATVLLMGGMNDKLRLYIPVEMIAEGMQLATPICNDAGGFAVLVYSIVAKDGDLYIAEYDGMDRGEGSDIGEITGGPVPDFGLD